MEKFKKRLLAIAGGLAGFAIAFMLFGKVAKMEVLGVKALSMNGMEAMFGADFNGGQIFGFSFMNLLTYIVGVVGVVFLALSEKKKVFWMKAAAAGCLFLTAIFAFNVGEFLTMGKDFAEVFALDGYSNAEIEATFDATKEMFVELDFAGVLGGIVLLLATAAVVADMIFAYLAKKAEENAVGTEVAAPAQENAVAAEEVAVTEEAPVEEETEEKAE